MLTAVGIVAYGSKCAFSVMFFSCAPAFPNFQIFFFVDHLLPSRHLSAGGKSTVMVTDWLTVLTEQGSTVHLSVQGEGNQSGP